MLFWTALPPLQDIILPRADSLPFQITPSFTTCRNKDRILGHVTLQGMRKESPLSAGRILVIDDEPQIRRLMRTTLISAGYEVDDAKTGEEGFDKVCTFHPDLVLLDINMPGMGGLAACEAIRADKNVAIIMLTVRNSEADKVAALDAGADDFVTKPFGMPELLARIRAALRRVPASQSAPAKIQIGTLVIDFVARTVSKGRSAPTHLTPKELELLRYFTQHANQAISHRELLQAVWGPDFGTEVDYLRVFIKNLRKKIEKNPEQPEYITTEPWVGYRFSGEMEAI
jgi:two-component system, OmpR family, KDP operon response regulator KdpE